MKYAVLFCANFFGSGDGSGGVPKVEGEKGKREWWSACVDVRGDCVLQG